MKRIFIVDGGIEGVKINCPPNAYQERFSIGRYTVHAVFLPEDYIFYIFKGDELKAIISNKAWYISRVDGECQNLLNRLLAVYG